MTLVNSLERKANDLRKRILEMCYLHGGHISTAYSCVEILVALYHGGVLRIEAGDPDNLGRDRFVVSKGHGSTGVYAVLADRGFFPSEWIDNSYRQGLCKLGGHVDCRVPGIEASTGALGHGLGIGCGLAYGAKMSRQEHSIYTLLGDAECSEGSIWEGALFAAQHKLDNLVAIIDRNFIGSLDYTRNYIAFDQFAEKWSSFGWNTIIVKEGHDIERLMEAFNNRELGTGKPTAFIVETVKGKGISFLEDDPIWHVRPVDDSLIEQARAELEGKQNG